MQKRDYVNTTKDGIRPPIVTVMGHVDHGKTSILDAIRHTNVQEKEYGGITQHIGAYQISHNDNLITFIDTPGHEAFTQMRARGGKAADLVVLVVAADEGVKPQTKEAISHIKAAKVPMIVAINKMDKAGANPDKVIQELSSENVLLEDWGGEIVSVRVSAVKGDNLDTLLDAILLMAEMEQIKGSEDSELEAVVIESKVDRKKGVVISCIVKDGVLKVGDKVIASGEEAKVRSIMADNGEMISAAGPSVPVEIMGFKNPPHVGDLILQEGSELAELSQDEDVIEIIGKNSKRTVSIILKADTQGTLEAVKGSLASLVSESIEATYSLRFVHSSTGDVSESDIMLAQSTNGIILAFNVRIPSPVQEYADSTSVIVKNYKTIYDLIDEAKELLEGTALEEESKIKGRAVVIKKFKLPSGDIVAGSKVLAGAIRSNSRVAIYDKDPSDITPDDEPLYRGQVKNLKKGKDEVSVVGKDVECGVLLKPQFDEISENMYIEVL